MTEILTQSDRIAWQPQPGPQSEFIKCQMAYEVGYGGALGGGKTDALLGNYAVGIDQGRGYKGVFFRKNRPDMDDVIQRSIEIFAPVYGLDCFNKAKADWNFPNGAILQFRGLEHDKDVNKFIGQQYTMIMWDQLEQWDNPFAYTFLMTRNRSAKGFRCQIRSAFNPGGIGHGWVQARFIDPMPPMHPLKVETKTPGQFYHRVFVPAKLEDNQILVRNDPGYGDRIYEGSDQLLAEALREGRWDIVSGAAFPEFDKNIHVIDPAPMPSDKPIMRAMDWGYDTPYGCLWGYPTGDGDFIIGNELYGWSGTPNVGIREAAEVVRAKISSFERAHEIYVPYGMLDNSCWDQDGRPGNIARELSGSVHEADHLVWKPWKKGPNSRVNQKSTVHSMLRLQNGKPRLYIMRNCRHLIRTLSVLPVDQKKREDVDTNAEDHLYDALRAMLDKKMPSRDQLRQRAMRRRMAVVQQSPHADLQYGY